MMNVNNTTLYSLNGVDTTSVAKVTEQILAKSSTNAQVASIDYSKFNRATLGVDLYSSRTSAQLQKQIALTQAALYVKSVNVAKLNSFAAANLYSAATVQKNVELTQSTTANELASPRAIEENNNRVVELFNIQDGSSNSSNGYNPFEETSDSEKSEK